MSDLIDRQAAIEVIDAAFPVDPMKSEYTQGIACGAALAKTYVEQLPSAQPDHIGDVTEMVGDTISRQDVIDAIVTWTVEDRPDIEMPTDLVARINALPAAQPEIIRCLDCIKADLCAWRREGAKYCSFVERRTDE